MIVHAASVGFPCRYAVLYASDAAAGLYFPTGLEGLGPDFPLPAGYAECVKVDGNACFLIVMVCCNFVVVL